MKNLRKNPVHLDISNITNSGGLIKVTTATAHGLATGNKVVIEGVLGTTEANNTPTNARWTIAYVDATSFTLNSSVYANVYVSGSGKIYLPYVLAAKISGTPAGGGHVIATVSFREVSNGIVVDSDTYEYKIINDTPVQMLYGRTYSSFMLMEIEFCNKSTSTGLVCTVQLERHADTLEPLTVTINANERASFTGGTAATIYDDTGAVRSEAMPPVDTP